MYKTDLSKKKRKSTYIKKAPVACYYFDTDKIYKDYPSISAFAKDKGITRQQINQVNSDKLAYKESNERYEDVKDYLIYKGSFQYGEMTNRGKNEKQ